MERDFFKELIENATDSIIAKDLSGRILYWNNASEKLFGYKADEVLGKTDLPRVPELKKAEESKLIENLLWGETIESFDTERITKAGEVLQVSMTVSLIKGPTGKIIGLSNLIRNIPERKRAQGKFQTLLESAPEAMVIVNEEGEIQLVNAQAEEMFEYKREELIGKKVEILMPERFKTMHPKYRRQFFTQPKVRRMGAELELFASRKSGVEFPVEISLYPLETEEGRWVSAAIRDITELKAYFSQQEQMKRKDLFLGIASHELKTPLTTIKAYISLLSEYVDRKPDSTLELYSLRLTKTLRRLEDLVSDLLDASRIQEGKMRFRMARHSLNEAIETSLNAINPSITKHQIILEQNEEATIVFDYQRIEQVLINLLTNAIKYSPKGGPIYISSRRNDKEVVVSIRDQGVGIPPEKIDKIFEGNRVNDTYYSQGLGVGLYISKEIILRHHGRIWAESAGDGEGTIFFFSIPVNLKPADIDLANEHLSHS